MSRIASLLRLVRFHRRNWPLAIIGIIWCASAIPEAAAAQGITVSGVAEGSAIVLPHGISGTNLTFSASTSNPVGATNAAFILEYQGSILASRTSAPPYSAVFSNLPAGKYYLSVILVGNGTVPSGDLSFDIAAASRAPVNDSWTNASPLTLNVAVAGTNTYATSEPDEPLHAGITASKSMWWSWAAVSNGLFTATTAGSGFDTVLAVYRGTNLNSLWEVEANDDAGPNRFSQATFFATNGTIYYFSVDSAASSESGSAQLRLTSELPPVVNITAPGDGSLFLITSPDQRTNTQTAATVLDPNGLARVDYWFDGGQGISRSGVLSAPFQLSLTNLSEGHYVLTISASNNIGLVTMSSAGFSVISLAPKLMLESFAMGKVQMGIMGFKGTNYSLQASTNLEAWCGVKGWTNFAGADKVADTNYAQFNRGFYRAATSP